MEALLAVFTSALVAATLLPLPSEAVLGALSAADGADVALLVAVATLGNVLGALVNFVLGRGSRLWRDRRWFPISRRTLAGATRYLRRRGRWLLLFAWLPVVGDPLTFAAGLLRMRTGTFLALVTTGKAARYIAVVLLARSMGN